MGKINMAITMRETLNSHPTSTLKKEISKTNIKGYSKMKKAEIIELMMKNKDRFLHIMFNEKKEKEPTKKDDSNLNFLNALSKETRKERLKLKKYSKYKLDTKGKAILSKAPVKKEPEKKKEEKKAPAKAPAKKAPVKKLTSKKKTDEEYQDELDKAIKIFRDKVENHKNILDIDYQTSIKFRKFNAYKNLLNTSVTGTIPERIEKYKKKLDYVDEVVKKNKIKVEKKKEEKKSTCESTSKKKHQ